MAGLPGGAAGGPFLLPVHEQTPKIKQVSALVRFFPLLLVMVCALTGPTEKICNKRYLDKRAQLSMLFLPAQLEREVQQPSGNYVPQDSLRAATARSTAHTSTQAPSLKGGAEERLSSHVLAGGGASGTRTSRWKTIPAAAMAEKVKVSGREEAERVLRCA